MTDGLLAVVDGGTSGLHPRAFAAAALAQKAVADTGAEADLIVIGGARPSFGRWRRSLRAAAADGASLASAIADHLEENDYAAVAIGDSPLGREIAGRLAARLGLPVVGATASFTVKGDALEVIRPAVGGKRTARLAIHRSPALLLIDPESAASATQQQAALPDAEDLPVDSADPPFAAVDEERLGPWEMDIAEADVVVAGGRGVGGPDGFALLADLAAVLEGGVGASRVAVDAGWAPRSSQVGLTGKTVSPRLYVACGISGAIHHTLGMRDSAFIVVINSDPQASIFKIANVSIVGDVREVVPNLIADLTSRRTAQGAAAVLTGGRA